MAGHHQRQKQQDNQRHSDREHSLECPSKSTGSAPRHHINHNSTIPPHRNNSSSPTLHNHHQSAAAAATSSLLVPSTTMATDDFMQSPLVTWAQTLLDESCDFQELCNGVFLNRAWLQIDPNPAYHFNAKPTVESSGDSMVNDHELHHQHPTSSHLPVAITQQAQNRRHHQLNRIRALWTLLNNVRTFYETVLDQVLVMRLPDVVNIAFAASNDDSDCPSLSKCLTNASIDEDVRSFLLLILGCAVQCDQKELFIERIKQLDISVQHAIVTSIQEITDNPDSVFLVNEWAMPPADEAQKDRLYGIFVNHISRLSKERDQLYQRVVDLSCELVNLSGQFSGESTLANDKRSLSNSSLNNVLVNDSASSKSHLLVELADAKSRLRRVQQELDEKNESLAELKEANEQSKATCKKLRTENLELNQEVRNAKAYRDEIDVLNERVRKVDRLESEAQKYREKLNELEFFKSRVEELRDDNRILSDTKGMLEEQLDTARKRTEKLPELEERILKLSAYGNELNLQRELDKSQIERLIEELSHLKQEKKAANEELSRVQGELADLKQQTRFEQETKRSEEGASLMDQINQDNHKRLIKLEHENKKLQNVIDDYQASYVDIDSLISLVGVTNAESTTSLPDDGQAPDSGCFHSNKSKTEKLNELRDYVDKLRSSQNLVKSLETQKIDLDVVNVQLKTAVTESATKMADIERQLSAQHSECQRLQRSLDQKSKFIERLDVEMASSRTEIATLQANSDNSKQVLKKLNELEIVMSSVESDRDRFEQTCKSAEKEVVRLKNVVQQKDDLLDNSTAKVVNFENENKRLKKELESQQLMTNRVRDLELENKDLFNSKSVALSTLASLQQELVEEKLAVQRHSAELESIHDLVDKFMAEIKLEQAQSGSEESLPVVVHRCLRAKREDIEHLEEKISSLKTQNQELESTVENLRQQLLTAETDRNDSEVLVDLQQKNQQLEDEIRTLREDVLSNREMHSLALNELEEIRQNLTLSQQKNTELQNETAKWQVENSLLKSQNVSLESQTASLRSEMVNIQESIQQLQVKCEEYENIHRNLMTDHESLEQIHQQLTVDYDHLNQSHSVLKQTNKSLKSSNKNLEDELQATISTTNTELAKLREQMESGDNDEEQLKNRVTVLQEENKTLTDELQRMQNEHKMMQNLYKKLRSENNELKLKYTELQGELANCQDRMNGMQTEMSKLTSYCEMVKMTDNALDSQRKKLNSYSTNIMGQYNDLVNDILHNGGFNPEYIKKMQDLKMRGDRYMKSLSEHDSVEGHMQRSKPFPLEAGPGSETRDTIYGRLWEAETGPLAGSSALLRQYSLNANQIAKNTPPRVPPRGASGSGASTPRSVQTTTIQHMNSHETVIELMQSPHSIDNKMSINVSTRGVSTTASGVSLKNGVNGGVELTNIENNFAKLQISSLNKSPSGGTSPASGGYFMRGSFKSNSVNYGNVMRHGAAASKSSQVTLTNKSKAIQLTRNIGIHLSSPNSVAVGMRSIYGQQHHPTATTKPTSFHSDSSSSSHSPQDFERVLENGAHHHHPQQNSAAQHRLSHYHHPHQRGDEHHPTGSVGNPQQPPHSAATNNNGDQNSKSQAIWYEYGCV